MLGFFPDPYPDELFYSICARYSARVRYPNKQRVNVDLFDKKVLVAAVYFPTRLNTLISFLQTDKYSADQFINENTIYPFYEPFINVERSKLIRHEMKSENDNRLRCRLSTNIHQVSMPEFLRFCPICVEQNRIEFGETYWHRSHQLMGVLVCRKHKCFLQNSLVRRGRNLSIYYRSAETHIVPTRPKLIDSNNSDDKLLIVISELAQWFLERNSLSLERGELRRRFYEVLLQNNYAYYNGKTKNKELVKLLNESFSPKILSTLGCSIKPVNNNWLSRMLNVGSIDVLHHPLRYFLLMVMLDINPADIFISYKDYKPFGDPPYPCLNKIAVHYLEPVINKVQIFDNATKDKRKQGIPLGVFSCDCRFIYQRLGPDKSESDKFKYNLVRSYGDVWEAKFTEMWADRSLSNGEIGKRTGISQTSVGRQAIRLNLPMNTKNTRVLQGYQRHRNPNKSHTEKREDYRKQWLLLIKENPHKSRLELTKIKSFVQNWLRKNDLKWYEAHSPVQVKSKRSIDKVDWKSIDKRLSEKVGKACKEIYSIKSFPVRVSMSEVIRKTDEVSWLNKRKKKLPLTNELLEQNLESLEDFMIRKIVWAKEYFIKEKKIPTLPQMKRKAVLMNSTSKKSSKIANFLEETLKDIKTQLRW